MPATCVEVTSRLGTADIDLRYYLHHIITQWHFGQHNYPTARTEQFADGKGLTAAGVPDLGGAIFDIGMIHNAECLLCQSELQCRYGVLFLAASHP